MDRDRHDRSRRLGWFDLDRVRSAKVTVVGCGAIGNEVAKDLVLSGFRDITLVDMDRVEGSNLNRCMFFSHEDAEAGRHKVEAVRRGMLSLDPGTRVTALETRVEDVETSVISGADVVLGCLDNIATRLHVNAHAMAAGVPYIDGATDGMMGKVQVVLPDGPCLECNMNRSHMRSLDLRRSCTGSDVSLFEPRLAAEITTTSVIAALMVREALKVVHGLGGEVMRGVLYYDGMRNDTSILVAERNPRCPHHQDGPVRPEGPALREGEEVERVG